MRALSRNTRRATAVTLAAALVIAVYLNWQYARSDVPTELPDNAAMVAAEAEDVPVQAQTVLDELPTEAEAVSSANKNYGEAQLVSVASDSGAKFLSRLGLSDRRPTMRRWIPSRNDEILVAFRRGKEGIYRPDDRKSGRSECGE